MGEDYTVSDTEDMVQASYNKDGLGLKFKAYFSPGPTQGQSDVEMICQMFRIVDSDAIKNCEKNFLNSLTESVELIQLKKGSTVPATAVRGAQPRSLVQSDIDELPASKVQTRPNSYAIVIGIERYRQQLPDADFALNDSRTVTNYLTGVMGYPEENMVVLNNDHAAKSDFEKYFEKWLPNHVDSGASVFVYFSGHGAPDPKTGNAYLVPYDGDPSFIEETGYSLQRLYAALGKLPARQVIVALDSCFSGAGGRSVLAKGTRPIVIQTKTPPALSENLTVLTASSADQISSTYADKGHGLFTYFLLKGIRNEDVISPDGTLLVDDLFDYLKPQVERVARRQYNNEQSPQLMLGNRSR